MSSRGADTARWPVLVLAILAVATVPARAAAPAADPASPRAAVPSATTAAAPAVKSSSTAAKDPFHLKPGARGKLCVSCHADFEQTLALPFVHTPVKEGDCVDCHNPHASEHGKMLAEAPDRICASCHSTIVPEGAKSVHKPVLGGGCVSCHDPHGSKNAGNLLKAGSELCFSCHKEIAAQAASNRFKHPPFEKGCLGCHTPHASSGTPSLLKKSVPALCADCHKTDQPVFTTQHAGYPVGKSDCTSCHDPHGSTTKGILWASTHPPVAEKNCAQCHLDPKGPNPLSTRKGGVDQCRGCHAEMVGSSLARTRPHWPMVDARACLNCHSPHASRTRPLLREPPKALCGTCHADTIERQARSLVKHPPIDDGDCATCHDPHGSDNEFLFTQGDVFSLCGTCHEWQKHSSHPIGEKVVDKRNPNLKVDCLSCHRSHGTAFKTFAHYDIKADLCVQCHQELRR